MASRDAHVGTTANRCTLATKLCVPTRKSSHVCSELPTQEKHVIITGKGTRGRLALATGIPWGRLHSDSELRQALFKGLAGRERAILGDPPHRCPSTTLECAGRGLGKLQWARHSVEPPVGRSKIQ